MMATNKVLRSGFWVLVVLLAACRSSLVTHLRGQNCLVVTPAGSGNLSGTDWNNARAGLSGLVRGNTYYLARGQYGKTTLGTAVSGSQVITIRAADADEHCTDTGWNEATMAATAANPAFFRNTTSAPGTFNSVLSINTSYWVIEGTLPCGTTQQCNLKIDNSLPDFVQVGLSLTAGDTNITVRRLEIENYDDHVLEPGVGPCTVTLRCVGTGGTSDSGCTDMTIEHNWMYNTQVHIQMGQGRNWLIQHNLFDVQWSDTYCHGNQIADQGSSDITIRYNWFLDTEGTNLIATVLRRSAPAQTAHNWQIYGNVASYRQGNPNGRRGAGNGAIACINGENCTNWKIYNNTITNIMAGNAGILYLNDATGTADVRNNLWYSCGGPLSISLPAGSTEDFNTALNCPTGAFTGANDVLQSSGARNPFIDWPNGNFRLVAPTAAGVSLSAPFNEDRDGKTRGGDGTWDRGAFEFDGDVTRPNPPANLRTTVR